MNLKCAGALLLLAPLTFSGVSAATAPAYYGGVDTSGALLVSGEGVSLEKETVRMEILDLPDPSAEAPFSEYRATVETEYEFYNGGAEDEELCFLLPCYRSEYIEGEPACTLTLNGAPLTASVRHCYSGYYARNPDLSNGEEKIKGSLDRFYTRSDLTVHEYNYTISIPNQEGDKYVFPLECRCNPLGTRIVSKNGMSAGVKNGDLFLRFSVQNGDTVTLYTVGEAAELVAKEVYDCNGAPCGSAAPNAEQTYSYREFAMRDYPQESGIAEEDWYNGFSQMLSEGTSDDGFVVYAKPRLSAEDFVKWYEYSVPVPAGGRATHTVKTVLYPELSNAGWEYRYLLSPSFRFSSFGTLALEVKTPYTISHGTLDLTETGEGETHMYSCSRDSLPLCEFSFAVRRAPEEAEKPSGLTPSIKIAIVILAVVAGGIAAAAVAYFAIRRRKRNKKE